SAWVKPLESDLDCGTPSNFHGQRPRGGAKHPTLAVFLRLDELSVDYQVEWGGPYLFVSHLESGEHRLEFDGGAVSDKFDSAARRHGGHEPQGGIEDLVPRPVRQPPKPES